MKTWIGMIGFVALAACGSPPSVPGKSQQAAAAPSGADAGLAPPGDCPRSLSGLDATARTIRKACGPVEVTAAYLVENSLTLEPGAVLAFDEGAEIGVGMSKPARLIVKGTDEEPVVFTSARDKVAGAWKGLRLYRNAGRADIRGLVVEYAGGDKGAVLVEADAVRIVRSTVRNAKEIGIYVDSAGGLAELKPECN